MVTSGTYQQSYSEEFNEQLGGDQHRLYLDITLVSQPSIHQFSQGSGGAGGNGQESGGRSWNARGKKRSQNQVKRDKKRKENFWSKTLCVLCV